VNPALLEQITEAVLYEGYLLYPYRPSSKKNARERFTFGRVYPEVYSIAQKRAERSMVQTECLVKPTAQPAVLQVSARFLQPLAREIGVLQEGGSDGSEYRLVPELRLGDKLYQPWLEALERTVASQPLRIESGRETRIELPFAFEASKSVEPISDRMKKPVGVIERRQDRVEGALQVEVVPVVSELLKVTVRIWNLTSVSVEELASTQTISMRTFASTHATLTVEGAEFISLLEPPDQLKEAAANCKNVGLWPVLIGDETKKERDTMLASPIILYDYPAIAPESAGPLFDGTEIDEILTLRILTMTDEEKIEMWHTDERARELLERTEAMPQADLLKLHGTIREPQRSREVEFDDFFGANTRIESVPIGERELRAGARVRIRPRGRGDIMDMVLTGKTAVVEAIEQDLEKRIHLALVLDDDPGREFGFERQTGHRFFFGVDEVEVVT